MRHTSDVQPGRADEIRHMREVAIEAEERYVQQRQTAIATFGLWR